MTGTKDSELLNLESIPLTPVPFQSALDFGAVSIRIEDHVTEIAGELGGEENGKGAANYTFSVGGRGRGGLDSKPWQQEGDWSCPNLSCSNINFSFRGICNRCGTARPGGSLVALSGVAGCVRSRGRGSGDSGCRSGRGSGGPAGLFGPNDWNCPMCGNVNWAKRTKCNICNTTKPGYHEGGAREGRAGGYKEFDEAEIEETKRRRREIEEDDGEMYDEFGFLKKKFRAKAMSRDSHVAAASTTGGMGKAGWEMEEMGVFEQSKEKIKVRDLAVDANLGGRNYFHSVPSARNNQRAFEIERNTQRSENERNIREGQRNLELHRSDYVENQDRISNETWSWERVVARDRGGTECVVDSENIQQGQWLRGRKRLRERDRILD